MLPGNSFSDDTTGIWADALDVVVSAWDFNQLVQSRALTPVFSLQSSPCSYINTSPYSGIKARDILAMNAVEHGKNETYRSSPIEHSTNVAY